ncbi:MAG: InlB B-repeat-containing protein [Clostridia bacterium]|nr:InlB B-repeat-containing protein [Clostridia bacterium]
MTKSISKKILLFLLSAFTVVCVSLFAFSGFSVKAAGDYQNTYGSQSVSSETEAELRKAELLGLIDQYKANLNDKIKVSDDAYWVFDVKEGSGGIVIEGEAVTGAVDKIDYEISKENWDAVNKSLFGDEGLNGILGIYEKVYAFYSTHVVKGVDGYCQVAKDNGMTRYTNDDLIASATEYLKNTKLQNFAQNNYKVAYADIWVNDFSINTLTKLVSDSDKQKLEVVEFETQVEYYRSFYFSERYDRSYVNKAVYGSSTNVDEEEAQKVVDNIEAIFAESATYADAKRLMAKAVDDYVKQVGGVKTVLERACDEIEERSNKNSQSYLRPSKIVEACENAFANHEGLGTLQHYKKGEDGEFIQIDLKTGKPVGDTTDMGDGAVLNRVLIKYKEALKSVINDEKQKVLDSNAYGISAGSKISDYVTYAKVLIESLGTYGVLPEIANADAVADVGVQGYSVATRYSYGEKEVINGSDIVNAFKDSFTVDGALVVKYNDQTVSSKSLEEYRLKSSLVYEKKDMSGKVEYSVTLTCVDKNGEEVNYFDGEAVLNVIEGASAAVERNIYLVLKGSKFKKATEGLTDDDKALLKDKVFFNYYTLVVSSPKFAGGKLDVLEMDKAIRVQVTFDFKDSDVLEKIKEKVIAFSYDHTMINNVYSDVSWGDTTMKFTISDFTNQAQFALANVGKNPIDWLWLGLIALAGVIVLFFVIWLIVAIVKNRKFKIFFNACGGKYNTTIKVKLHEKFNHPAAPTKPGYVFLGWYLDLKCTVKFAMTELSKKGNLKVYAKWISEEDFNELNEEYENAVKPEETVVPVPEVVSAPEVAPETVEETVTETVEEPVEEVVEVVEEVVEETSAEGVDFESAIEKAKAETEEKLRQEVEKLERKIEALEASRVCEAPAQEEKAEEVAPEVVEEETDECHADFDVVHAFDVLKAEIYSFTDADDLGYGLDAKVDACALKVVGDTVELEVNLDLEDCLKKGYNVVKGDKLAVKFVVCCDCKLDEAFELIGETMFVNGLEKTRKAVETASTEETRLNGFEYGVTKEKVADTVEEFYKLLRVYTQSFVLADDGDVEEKALVKMFLARGKVYAYLNYTAEGLNACDDEMAKEGYKSFMTVKNADDCRKALALIGAMMKENGLVRFPSKVEIAGSDCKQGFTYSLKK